MESVCFGEDSFNCESPLLNLHGRELLVEIVRKRSIGYNRRPIVGPRLACAELSPQVTNHRAGINATQKAMVENLDHENRSGKCQGKLARDHHGNSRVV